MTDIKNTSDIDTKTTTEDSTYTVDTQRGKCILIDSIPSPEMISSKSTKSTVKKGK